jgi:hypothetical protein
MDRTNLSREGRLRLAIGSREAVNRSTEHTHKLPSIRDIADNFASPKYP